MIMKINKNSQKNRGGCEIAQKQEHVWMSSLQLLQIQPEYNVNELSVKKNGVKLTEIQLNSPQKRKCNISPERGHANLSSLRDLQTTLEYVLNEPQIIRNNGNLTDLRYLLSKTENGRYLQNADTQTSCLFGTFKLHQNML